MAQKSKPSAKAVKASAPKSAAKPVKAKSDKPKSPASKNSSSKETAPKTPAAKGKVPQNGHEEDADGVRIQMRLPRDAKTLAFFDRSKQRLLELRDHFLDQMQSVAQNSLRSRSESNEASAVGQHQADAGSDAYEKDFALSLLSQEQDALYEIEEALKRIEIGTYGVCEMSNKTIPHARLEAIPFARFTVECQQQLEKENRGRRRWDTAPQFMDSAEAFADEEEEQTDDDDKKKEKD
jgi:RNA polymerase-binding transcription factor DksA